MADLGQLCDPQGPRSGDIVTVPQTDLTVVTWLPRRGYQLAGRGIDAVVSYPWPWTPQPRPTLTDEQRRSLAQAKAILRGDIDGDQATADRIVAELGPLAARTNTNPETQP